MNFKIVKKDMLSFLEFFLNRKTEVPSIRICVYVHKCTFNF